MPPSTHRRKITQKELKAPDELTTLVDSARDFLVKNLTQVLISTAVVVIVGAIVIGVYYYERHRDNIASARFYSAITALNAGQNKLAETQFKQLVDEEPGRRLGRLARFYMASAYLADGDLAGARDSLVAFLAAELDVARMLAKSGDKEGAIAAYRGFLAAHPFAQQRQEAMESLALLGAPAELAPPPSAAAAGPQPVVIH